MGLEDGSDPNVLAARFILIYKEAIKYTLHFCRRIEDSYGLSYKLSEFYNVSPDLVGELVVDYFKDVDRIKSFHNIKKINSIKIAAYTCFWIARKKPIQIVKSADFIEPALLNDTFLLYINESFAIHMLFALSSSATLDDPSNNKKAFINFLGNLRYHLTYRIFTAQTLEIMIAALFTNYNYKRSNMINNSH